MLHSFSYKCLKRGQASSPIIHLPLALDIIAKIMSSVPPVLSSPEVVRPISSYAPDIWGDRFRNYVPQSLEQQEKEVGKLKDEVRDMLSESANDLFHRLHLIDDIQRLGVAYHFEREIKEALESIYGTYRDLKNNCMDLNCVSLCFRLLRQQGINIPSDIFTMFKDENGTFKEGLATDVEGLLSLYEAAHLGVREETVLEEALLFSTTHLEAVPKHGSNALSKMVAKALNRPLRKSLVRVNAAHFISIYKDRPSCNETLLKFATLDFNRLQSIHKEELSDMRKWWSGFEFPKRFPFARDRMVECFFWISSMGVQDELCHVRKMATKLICLLSIMDDIYDSYGTLEELSLFTAVIKSWSCESVNDLPAYMKIYHQAFLDFFEEIQEIMIKQGTLYRISYAKEAVDRQVDAYIKEAEWCNKNYVPKVDEYLSVSVVSCGYALISTMWYVCMADDAVTEEDLQWLRNQPEILKAAQVICRLMDDMVSDKREKENKHVSTGIECYTTEHGVTEEEALRVFQKRVSDAWKDINQEFLKPTAVKMSLLSLILNLAQVMDELYKEEDAYTVVGQSVKDAISALFINPLLL